MRPFSTIAFALSAAVLLSACDDRQAAFQSAYDAMDVAITARNRSAILAVLTPDFESVDTDGHVIYGPQMVAAALSIPQDPNRTSRTRVVSVDGDDKRATVEQVYEMSTLRGEGQGSHKIEMTARSQDVWTSDAGSWQLKSTTTNEITYRIDGKVVMHKLGRPG